MNTSRIRDHINLLDSILNEEQGSDLLHVPKNKLNKKTYLLHQAIISLIEELEAVNWYRQRADDCKDKELKNILLHNMREEIEHATMLLEWVRRNNSDFQDVFAEILNKSGSITKSK